MQTNLAPEFRGTPDGEEADAILRACVHCGFCTATCPTYQLLGDELDGPRGRIYLIKQVLEGGPVTAKTQLHLDRCLTCRSCETTCPSGVRYGRLADIGRKIVEDRVGRGAADAAVRWSLRKGLTSRSLFGGALALGRIARGLVPRELGRRIPASRPAGPWPAERHPRRMIALEGCVQPSIAPATDAALARVLDRIGISLVRVGGAGCCAAVPYHLNDHDGAREMARRNIDAWWPHLAAGAEAVVVTASGCGVMVKDYGHLLAHDPAYAERAAKVAALARDTVEVVGPEWKKIAPLVAMDLGPQRVAFHAPCSLQHGMKIRGEVEEILRAIGHELLPVADAHLCCGSAGTYSILQPEIASTLKRNKLAALEADRPSVIATANIGCQAHLASGTARPVRHWIELLDERMPGGMPAARR
ncbi:MAG TPA: glycolate oxidase subunit GlcF [Casimicrobiaceae bacterium]|nr:glycolate oxidase subunit GlcF [Casimicrobiaceae bacterium]